MELVNDKEYYRILNLVFGVLSQTISRLAIAAWSSGTGAAGLLGSFSYAFLTDRSMADLQPKVALLIQLFIPIVFAITYFFVLVVPEDVHQPGWNPKTWIVPDHGHTQLVIFNCHEGFHLTLGAQYRWYQATNFFFFFFEAIYWFVPSIGIIFALIVFEGLLGGAAYVNTFDKIHKMVPADVREYSLSVATVGDSIGINFAGFMSIPIHNFICARPMPSVR
ncbi:CLN3 protein [Ancylostoma duodenale]|uniref:CLN3 protein n=1 Tax=Ancylostoma duodenale TaxID=51022 RepID=A0A0C2H0N8_9BILA|nr:CLN3 protein [Ancylostoma duodenale]